MGTYGQNDMTLAGAREAARAAKALVRQGICPKAEAERGRAENEKAERLARQLKEDTLAAAFEDYISDKLKSKALKSSDELRRLFRTKVEPELGKRPIREITRDDLRRLLRRIVDGGAPVSANRTHSLLRPLFRWALAEERIDANPFDGVPQPVSEVSRDRVLSEDEIRLFWLGCDRLGYPFGSAFQMLLLTLCRRDEVCRMMRPELELGKALWTLPAERSKNGMPADIPLSETALQIMQAAPTIGGPKGPVFTSGATKGDEVRPISGYSKAKRAADAVMLEIARQEAAEAGQDPDEVEIPRWTLHDLRRTGATQLARMGAPLHVVEMALNHRASSLGGVAQIYNRHSYFEERRHWLQAWAVEVERIVSKRQLDNVVELRGGGA